MNMRFITFGGRTMCLREWSRSLGSAVNIVSHRLARGWPPEKAVTIPRCELHSQGPHRVEEENLDLFDDVRAGENSARLLGERYGVSERTIVRVRKRLRARGVRVRVPFQEEMA